MVERTLSMVKPDGMRRHIAGAICQKIEDAGLKIIAQKRIRLSPDQAAAFYAVHRERPFFGELCQSISAGPVLAQVLQGENAIQRYRDLMGATNPSEAAEGTLRKEFGVSVGENTVHGSDAPETASKEISFFFSGLEIDQDA